MEALISWPAVWFPGVHLVGRGRLELEADGHMVARNRWHVRMVQALTEQRVKEVDVQINLRQEGGRVANCTWSRLWVPSGPHTLAHALWVCNPASGPGMLDH